MALAAYFSRQLREFSKETAESHSAVFFCLRRVSGPAVAGVRGAGRRQSERIFAKKDYRTLSAQLKTSF
jgi:hypothetical protein